MAIFESLHVHAAETTENEKDINNLGNGWKGDKGNIWNDRSSYSSQSGGSQWFYLDNWILGMLTSISKFKELILRWFIWIII